MKELPYKTGRWHDDVGDIYDEDGHYFVECREPMPGMAAGNSARIVACVNFCAGVAASELAANRSLADYIASNHAELTRLRSDLAAMREALRDMHAGWRYIREVHGDLYGVGWDRCEEKASAALAKGGQP